MKKSDIVSKVLLSNQHPVSPKFIQQSGRVERGSMVDPLIDTFVDIKIGQESLCLGFDEHVLRSTEITQDGRIILLLSC